MIINFGEGINEVCSFLQMDRASVDAAVLASIKRRFNQVQDYITFLENWEWRKRTFYQTLRTPYVTGTLTAIQFNTLISGSGTTWTKDMELGYLVIDGIALKIKSVGSTTSITLETPYPNANTGAGKAYSIVFPDYFLNHRISGILDVRLEGRSLDVGHQTQLIHSFAAIQEPAKVAFGQRLINDFFNSSTVSVTNGSPTVTLASGTFPLNIDDTDFMVKEFSKKYTIKTRDSDTVLTLDDNYEGDTGSGKAFAICPKGTNLIRFSPSPNDYYYCEIDALLAPEKLINDTDYSIIPSHHPLLMGAIWLCAIDYKNDNPVRIQQARADFERSINTLRKQYKTVGNLRWTTADEEAFKRTGLSTFDPLRSNYA